MKKSKLHFEKFQILKMKNLHQISGGTEGTSMDTITGPNHTVDPDGDTIDTNTNPVTTSNPVNPLSSRPCKAINTGG